MPALRHCCLSRILLLCVFSVALGAALTPAFTADRTGYLPVTGPAPIRFQSPRAPDLPLVPNVPPPSHTPPLPSNTLNPPLGPAVPDPEIIESANLTTHLQSEPSAPQPNPPPFEPQQPVTEAAPTQQAFAPTAPSPSETYQSVPDASAGITPQAVLPLFFDESVGPETHIIDISTISFVPPQAFPHRISRATYSVIP
jgi:hypothetical protein